VRGHNVQMYVSVSDLYIPTIDMPLPILLQEIKCVPILGAYAEVDECGNWD
jgi:hypothetical protein